MADRAEHPVPFKGIFTHADLAALGIPDARVRYWLRHHLIERVSKGVFAPRGMGGPSVSRAMLTGSEALSLQDAAAAYGILLPPSTRTSVSRPIRVDRVSRQFLTEQNGVLVPTADWAAVSLARYQALPHALIPLDSALRAGVSRSQLESVALAVAGRPGTRNLERAIVESSASAESALESLARGAMILAGLPRPRLQVEFSFVGCRYRVDFAWPAQRLILEADGLVKYRRAEDMWAEKRRQSDLQAAGWEIWRCLWRDVVGPDTKFLRSLAARLAR